VGMCSLDQMHGPCWTVLNTVIVSHDFSWDQITHLSCSFPSSVQWCCRALNTSDKYTVYVVCWLRGRFHLLTN
jgi:hypothetical protein